MDELLVRACLQGTDATTTDLGRLAAALADQVRRVVGVQPRIEPVAPEDLYPTGAALKARRFVDRRDHEEQG
jgi:hypothetical protein